jgi:hypothetical protein
MQNHIEGPRPTNPVPNLSDVTDLVSTLADSIVALRDALKSSPPLAGPESPAEDVPLPGPGRMPSPTGPGLAKAPWNAATHQSRITSRPPPPNMSTEAHQLVQVAELLKVLPSVTVKDVCDVLNVGVKTASRRMKELGRRGQAVVLFEPHANTSRLRILAPKPELLTALKALGWRPASNEYLNAS